MVAKKITTNVEMTQAEKRLLFIAKNRPRGTYVQDFTRRFKTVNY
jgi:hypothetical protein